MSTAPDPDSTVPKVPWSPIYAYDKFGIEHTKCADPLELGFYLDNSIREWRKIGINKDYSINKLKLNAKKHKLKFRGHALGDESCFYRAVSDQMRRCGMTPKNHVQLRNELNDYIRRNPVIETLSGNMDLRLKVWRRRKDWSTYLAEQMDPKTWADEVAIIAMAHYLQKDILLVFSCPWSPNRETVWICVLPNQDEQPLLLGHMFMKTFQSLEPTDSQEPYLTNALASNLRYYLPEEQSIRSSSQYSAHQQYYADINEQPPEVTSTALPQEESSSETSFGDEFEEDLNISYVTDMYCQLQGISRSSDMTKRNMVEANQRYLNEKLPDRKLVYLEDLKQLDQTLQELQQQEYEMEEYIDNREQEENDQKRTSQVMQHHQLNTTHQQRIKFQPGSLRENLQVFADVTRNDPQKLLEQIQPFRNRLDWISCHVVDFLSMFEMLRSIVGNSCTPQICGQTHDNISLHLSVVAVMLDDRKTFPLLPSQPYPKTFINDVKIMFTYLCKVFIHFYEDHAPKIGPSLQDVAQIGLHFYTYVKMLHLVDADNLRNLEHLLTWTAL